MGDAEGTITPSTSAWPTSTLIYLWQQRGGGEIFYFQSLSLFIYPRLKTVNMGSVN